MHTARMHGRTKTCFAGTHCVRSLFKWTRKKSEKEKRTKRWISSRSVHSTHSSVVINRSILIYMARSQFAELNMLVLYFSPKHFKWEFLNIFCSLLTRKLSNVFKLLGYSTFCDGSYLGWMSLVFSLSATFTDIFDYLTVWKHKTHTKQSSFCMINETNFTGRVSITGK
jgi:hypothetical protein